MQAVLKQDNVVARLLGRHVSPKPPFDPGRPDFQGPVLAWAWQEWPSRIRKGLNAGAHIHACLNQKSS